MAHTQTQTQKNKAAFVRGFTGGASPKKKKKTKRISIVEQRKIDQAKARARVAARKKKKS